MVTHDQQLKYYAHRVVHMMDGKVLRIETIPDTVRHDMDVALVKKMDDAVRRRTFFSFSFIWSDVFGE